MEGATESMDVWYNGKYGISFYEYGTELNPIGAFIGHTWKNWSLVPASKPFVAPAKRKTKDTSTDYTNGKTDLSSSLLGFPLYDNREGTWSFYVSDFNAYQEPIIGSDDKDILDNLDDPILSTTVQTFPEKYTELQTKLNGKTVAIVLDEDPRYFYRGTVDIESWTSPNNEGLNTVDISYSVFPYKIEIDPTRVIIKDSNGNGTHVDEDLSFSVGTMPVIPYLVIKKSDSRPAYYRIGFSNPEINGVSQSKPSMGVQYNYISPRTNSIDDKSIGKLIAEYKTNAAVSVSRSSFLCSNVRGNTECSFSLSLSSTRPSDVLVEAFLEFRKGYL